MSAAVEPEPTTATEPAAKPKLVFFHSPRSGRCRRAEGWIAQVLQHRHNHETFELVRVSVDDRPDLARRFGITEVPTLCVIQTRKLQRRIVAPRGCRALERDLEPWLR